MSLFLSSPVQIRKDAVPDLREPHRRTAAQKHNMCHAVSCFFANMLCSPLPRHRPLTTGKRRFAYSQTVVHFRKPLNNGKVGSPGNRHPVIY